MTHAFNPSTWEVQTKRMLRSWLSYTYLEMCLSGDPKFSQVVNEDIASCLSHVESLIKGTIWEVKAINVKRTVKGIKAVTHLTAGDKLILQVFCINQMILSILLYC